MKKRSLKSGKKAKGETSNADPKLYHGARGRYHYFQCLQLILRKQIAALTALWDLPPEFAVICRDVWALNLSLLPDPPPAEPYHHAQENRVADPTAAKDGQDAADSPKAKQASDGDGGEDEAEDDEEKDDEKLEDEEDSELEALMRENSEISSSSDDEGGDVPHAGPSMRYRKDKGRLAYESPMSTIAVLVVACWTMRIPVLYSDFTRIIESYELPYLEAVMSLPQDMAQHLTKHNVQALSPPAAAGDAAVSDYFGGNGERDRGPREEEQEDRVRLGGKLDDSEGLLAGEEYKIWSARDVDGALPEELERVVNRAAAVAGVRVEYMVGVVETFERRLVKERPEKAEKKMRRFASVFLRRKDKDKDRPKAKHSPPPSDTDPSDPPSTPQLSILSAPASSASSSSHSASLPPIDEHKGSWRRWVGPKRTPASKADWPPEEEEVSLFLEIHLQNSLVPQLPVAPFVQHNLGPFFPRSSNRPHLLPPSHDIRVTMFRKNLLTRLKRGDLSPSELASIRPLSSKQTPSLVSAPPPSFPDSAFPPPTTKVLPASPGVRRWISRPCFEDRYEILLPVNGHVQPFAVSSATAVAALEYSEHLDVMADPDFDLFSPSPPAEPTPPATHSHAPTLEVQPPTASLPKRNSYTSTPSPLRNSNSPPTPSPPAPEKSALKSAVKRIVRFAEDDSDGDDGLPLHIVRMKKKREQKANFLKEERLRRAKEEEQLRRQREQEARQREQEALELERKRQEKEKERREKEKALYAETIAATRLRRETARTGGIVSSNTSSSLLLPSSSSSTSLKDAERNRSTTDSRRFSRIPHDAPPSISIPRREHSDPAMYPSLPSSYNHQQYLSDSSPGSSRPPSIGYSPVSLNSPVPGPHSRPPSTYSHQTSSSEDVRFQGGSKRNSAAAVAANARGAPMIVSYPTWSGSNPNISYIPPIPPLPDYIHDMPLLPPTAPFMKSPYKARSSSSSRNESPARGSTSSGSRRGSFNSSSERVNQVSPSPPNPNPRRQSSASVAVRPTHHRQNSGDSRHTSKTHHSSTPQRPTPVTSRSQPTLSRGRSLQPQYLQAPGTWMGPLPPQSPPAGPMPMFVPVPVPVPYSHMAMSSSSGNLQQLQAVPVMPMAMGYPMGNFGVGLGSIDGDSRKAGSATVGSVRSKRQTVIS
ncbi:hypothetical protein CVT26_005237 [Gymnopilus dilepis]|uniref:Rrn7/TAF1B N-terminal cyclin domain-containing protein n=1 Tax=Gymnopilus dilepis TaxID=231916 RepID=A0A409YVJ0_9AGAR|nr:hypothetical protein CVT26_005237 [Gymnopilus dilepis]